MVDNQLSWSIVNTAPSVSALAGLIAGFSFTGLTIVLTRQRQPHTKDEPLASYVIGEFLLASVILGVASLEWALIAGETVQNHVRAQASGAFAGLVLVIGSMQMATGISYLIMEFVLTSAAPVSRGFLASLCHVCYRALAAVEAFYIAWVVLDVLSRGFTDGTLYSDAWYLRVVPFVAAAVVNLMLGRRQRAQTSYITILAEETSRWRSEWLAVGSVGLLTASGFMGTIYFTTDGSLLAEAGEWQVSPGILLYCVVLVLSSLAAIYTLILQGWLLKERDPSGAFPPHPSVGVDAGRHS